MKINNLIIKLFIFIFSLSLFCVNHSFAQDSQVIKKIIIDEVKILKDCCHHQLKIKVEL